MNATPDEARYANAGAPRARIGDADPYAEFERAIHKLIGDDK